MPKDRGAPAPRVRSTLAANRQPPGSSFLWSASLASRLAPNSREHLSDAAQRAALHTTWPLRSRCGPPAPGWHRIRDNTHPLLG
jgi:hypothetical protein